QVGVDLGGGPGGVDRGLRLDLGVGVAPGPHGDQHLHGAVLGTLLAHFSSSFFFQGAPSTSSGWVRSTDDSEPPIEVLPFSNSPIRYSSTSSGVPSRFLDIDPPTLLVQLPLASSTALQPHQLRLQLLVGAGQ